MNYKKIYDNLVLSRKDRLLKEGEYYEKHHIVPKCIDGITDQENLVTLTAREHYIAHWLLTKIYKDVWKLYFAFYQMSKMNKVNDRVISSKQFDRAKRHLSIGTKLRHIDPLYDNPGKSEKSRSVARERMLSNENPMKKYPEKNPFLGKSYVAGKKWYNNGTENRYLSSTDVIPDGFVSGMKPYKRIRNGVESNHQTNEKE